MDDARSARRLADVCKSSYEIDVDVAKLRSIAMQDRHEIHNGIVPLYQPGQLGWIEYVDSDHIQTRQAPQVRRGLCVSGRDRDPAASVSFAGQLPAQTATEEPCAAEHKHILTRCGCPRRGGRMEVLHMDVLAADSPRW